MKTVLRVMAVACAVFVTAKVVAQIPTLPDGAQTRWVVGEPEEIIAYVTFDPASVKLRLRPTLRFVTVKELATGGVVWAKDYLARHPRDQHWGISFLEIVRTGTFTIDGRAPQWPKDGAAALWCARVAQSDPSADFGPGNPLLVLEFWMPDRAYAAYMCAKGHYAAYGDVKLYQHPDGRWHGSLKAGGLDLVAECNPTGPVTGGAGAAGMQVFFPPLSSSVKDVVRVAFAGHRVQQCSSGSFWRLRGTHPLVGGTVLQPSNFEFGYDLIGGAYPLQREEASLR